MSEDTNKKTINWAKEIWEWFYTIIIALVIAMLIKTFLFDVVKVDGSSMFPTLENNDRLIVTKLGYEPSQGDIIILDSTYEKREEYYSSLAQQKGVDELGFVEKFAESRALSEDLKKRYYVKRIIALPGQTIDLRDGKVYIDDQLLDEPYYDGITESIDATVEYPVTVEPDTVFVMGDNRTRSKDSRSSDLGLVPYDAILGKAKLRIWPFSALGFVD